MVSHVQKTESQSNIYTSTELAEAAGLAASWALRVTPERFSDPRRFLAGGLKLWGWCTAALLLQFILFGKIFGLIVVFLGH